MSWNLLIQSSSIDNVDDDTGVAVNFGDYSSKFDVSPNDWVDLIDINLFRLYATKDF